MVNPGSWRAGLVRALRALPYGQSLVDGGMRWRHSWELSRAGLLDLEFYAAQAGEAFTSRRQAAHHYLTVGRPAGLAPNPLFEPEWFSPQHWQGWREPLIGLLRRGPGGRGCSPLFDAAAYAASHPAARRHPGGALGHFLTTAQPADLVPVPPDYPGAAPTWRQARSALLERARQWGASRRVHAPRRQPSWDLAAARQFVRTWSAAPLPAEDGDAPLVSVVLPVHNRPELVAEAIASVQAQTLRSWELLVADDGSTDRTADVVQQMADSDQRIRLLRLPKVGVSGARNAALDAASGSYVAFLDSDNTWEPDFLRVMVACLHGNGWRAGHSVVDWTAGGADRYVAMEGGLDCLLVRNHVPMIALVVRRDLLDRVGRFDPGLRRWVDHDLVIRLAKEAHLHLIPFIGSVIDDDRERQGHERITLSEHDHWRFAVLGKHSVDWPACERRLSRRVAGRVSVCLTTHQDWGRTSRTVDQILADAGDRDVEVVIVDNGSRRAISAILQARYLGDQRVRVISRPAHLTTVIAANVALSQSTGEHVVFLDGTLDLTPGWLAGLVAPLDDPRVRGVQALLMAPDGTIRCAGSVFTGPADPPMPLLRDHPLADAERAQPIRLSAVSGAALAMRAAEAVGLRGFDPMYFDRLADTDLCLRAVRAHGGWFEVAPGSIVIESHEPPAKPGRDQVNAAIFRERWAGQLPVGDQALFERLGWSIAHLDPGICARVTASRPPRPVLSRKIRAVDDGLAAGLPSLRWAIKIASPAGAEGDTWGDTHFAQALSRSLERLGQEVAIDHRQAHERNTSYLDDVVLTIRGLSYVPPQLGKVNLLWVISHPEVVSATELRGYDAVFAASPLWAQRTARRTGMPVTPLLQATDPELFGIDLGSVPSSPRVLFVGNSRRIERPIVRDAIAAGIDLAIFGGGWEGTEAEPFVRGHYIANHELAAWYGSAGVVLCDHWAEMAEEGFVSNRIFDALACGARVISDQVAGLSELFGGSVQVYRDPDHLRQLTGPGLASCFPSDEARRDLAKKVADQHSFDARAAQLLDAALAVRSAALPTARPSASAGGRRPG